MSETVQNGDIKKKETAKKSPSILFKKTKKGRAFSGWMGFLRYVVVPAARIVYPFKFVGPKKVADGPCVYVSNHYRMIDPRYLDKKIYFVAFVGFKGAFPYLTRFMILSSK